MLNPFQLEQFMKKVAHKRTPYIWGLQAENQPRVKTNSSRYYDGIWNESIYPKYISGGGFLMNWKAAMVIQDNRWFLCQLSNLMKKSEC